MVKLIEIKTTLPLEKTNEEIRRIALIEKAKITVETPKHIEINTKDWNWKIIFDLIPEKKGTRVVSDTKIRTYVLILLGIFIPIYILMIFYSWIQFTILDAYVQGLRSSLQGSILEFFGYSNLELAESVVGIIGLFPIILILLLIIAMAWFVIDYYRRERIAERILALLPKS